MIENLNSGGFQWNEKCLATDGTVVCLRHCLTARQTQAGGEGGSVSNFVENLRERWTGLWPHNGFSVLNLLKIQRGMILGVTSHKLLLFCFRDIPKISQRRFPRSGNLRIEALRQQPPSLGFKSKQLAILSPSLQGGEHLQRGRMQGWSFILVLCKESSTPEILLVLSKGNHIGSHRYHPLPA